jgi:parallel beta-helix repeat protein
VNGNTTSGGSIGISCDTSPDSAVTGNTVTGAKLYGIEVVKSNNIAVSGNTVTGGALTVRGIAVNGTSSSSAAVSITGNNVTDCTGYGIRSQGATQITIAGNACQLTGSAGIYTQNAAYATVTGNIVVDVALTMNDGIFFDGCTWLTCTGNTVAGVDNNGILVYAASAVTVRAFVFANALDVVGVAQPVATNLSGGAALSAVSQIAGNSGVANQVDWLGVVKVATGTGSPEGAVVGGIGSLYLRTDGSTSTTLYVKTAGAATTNTGWTAK